MSDIQSTARAHAACHVAIATITNELTQQLPAIGEDHAAVVRAIVFTGNSAVAEYELHNPDQTKTCAVEVVADDDVASPAIDYIDNDGTLTLRLAVSVTDPDMYVLTQVVQQVAALTVLTLHRPDTT